MNCRHYPYSSLPVLNDFSYPSFRSFDDLQFLRPIHCIRCINLLPNLRASYFYRPLPVDLHRRFNSLYFPGP